MTATLDPDPPRQGQAHRASRDRHLSTALFLLAASHFVSDAVHQGAGGIVVDLRALDFVDVSGMSAPLVVADHGEQARLACRVAGLTAPVRSAIAMASMTEQLDSDGTAEPSRAGRTLA